MKLKSLLEEFDLVRADCESEEKLYAENTIINIIKTVYSTCRGRQNESAKPKNSQKMVKDIQVDAGLFFKYFFYPSVVYFLNIIL